MSKYNHILGSVYTRVQRNCSTYMYFHFNKSYINCYIETKQLFSGSGMGLVLFSISYMSSADLPHVTFISSFISVIVRPTLLTCVGNIGNQTTHRIFICLVFFAKKPLCSLYCTIVTLAFPFPILFLSSWAWGLCEELIKKVKERADRSKLWKQLRGLKP